VHTTPVPPIRVLLVDGDPADAESLLRYLHAVDAAVVATVVRVDALARALDAIGRQRPDVILLDLQLPDSSGLETLRRVRAVAPGTPVVVLGETMQHGLALEAVQCGAQDYLLKGQVDGDLLLRAVRHAIERERMQRAAREDEALLRLVLESAPIAKAIAGLDGRWRLVNRALCELTGYTEAELLARTLQQLTHPADRDAPLVSLGLLRAGDARAQESERRLVRKDGSVLWVQLSVRLIRGEDGDARALIVQIQDITARRRAAERTRQLLAVTASLADVRTSEAVASRVTARLVEVLGAAAASVVVSLPGARELRLLASAGAPDWPARSWARFPISAPVPMAEAVRSGRPIWLESRAEIAARYPVLDQDRTTAAFQAIAVLPLVVSDGVAGALTMAYAPRDGGPDARAHVAGDAHGFDEEDRAMHETIAHQCALALERARLFEAEQEASTAARAASEAKSRFLAVMSHELRTPLSVIVGFTELLADGLAGTVTDQQQTYLARIRTSADHLLVMIDDILTLSRMEAGREPVREEPVRLGEVVHEVAALFDPTAHAKGLTLVVELPKAERSLVTDRSKLRQILINLLGNAVKFTDGGDGRPGRVELRVVECEPTLAIQVRDTGIGIAAEHIAHIFEPFWQVDQTTHRRFGGTGLGLEVSLRLARLLGGDLRVHSTPGQGSTFTLLLPSATVGERATADVA
jgi:PAS domain S-box-containing protein